MVFFIQYLWFRKKNVLKLSELRKWIFFYQMCDDFRGYVEEQNTAY
jgi:hypothetical protein